ncbi:DDE-type integrase/transposase/recombinase [Williamsoniiplasma luminosum]|nr:IS3 family transposase [Williamsoniiplasma luminosum]
MKGSVEFFMSKQLTTSEWVEIVEIYNKKGIDLAVTEYLKTRDKNLHLKDARKRIRKKAKLLDNLGMQEYKKKKINGRPLKRDDSDIPGIIDKLNEEQKREIIEHWIKDQRDKEKKEKLSDFSTLTNSLKAEVVSLHRTTMYKKHITKTYKYDYLKAEVVKIFNESKKIYGSRKIAIILGENGISISDRTLRNYMIRWGIATLTRQKKRKSEQKNTKVKYVDQVNRNYNPEKDNIVATDVSYIPANTQQNFVYLSVVISHKTKLIESWKLSYLNDTKLVLDTIDELKRTNFIFHSDHGIQYSSYQVIEKLRNMSGITSMSRIGNSLDNREVEYFFSCLKGEYLNHIKTKTMGLEEIHKHIAEYIEWYNSKRIQKRLNWKTPAYASALNS